jgi:dienelactone hydrolase
VGLLCLAVLVLASAGCQQRFRLGVDHADTVTVDWSRSTDANCNHGVLPYRALGVRLWWPTTGGPWPLIVLAPGFNANGSTYDVLGTDLASAGYVVAAPSFPLSGPGSCPTSADIPNQPGDISHVISYVLDGSSPASGRVDGRVGVVGHSDGGLTVAAMALIGAFDDPRVSAYVDLSAGVPRWLGTLHPNRAPFLVDGGDADPGNPITELEQAYDWASAPKAFVADLGADHTSAWFDDDAAAHVARDTVVAFLDRWVRDDPEATARFTSLGMTAGVTWSTTDGW